MRVLLISVFSHFAFRLFFIYLRLPTIVCWLFVVFVSVSVPFGRCAVFYVTCVCFFGSVACVFAYVRALCPCVCVFFALLCLRRALIYVPFWQFCPKRSRHASSARLMKAGGCAIAFRPIHTCAKAPKHHTRIPPA